MVKPTNCLKPSYLICLCLAIFLGRPAWSQTAPADEGKSEKIKEKIEETGHKAKGAVRKTFKRDKADELPKQKEDCHLVNGKVQCALQSTKEKFRGASSKARVESKEFVSDTKKVTRRTVRQIKDDTCELTNGELECEAQKSHHLQENADDEAHDKMNDALKTQ